MVNLIKQDPGRTVKQDQKKFLPTTIHYPVGFVPNKHLSDTTLHDGIFYLEEHPSPAIDVWETNWAGMGWEEERLLGQTACSHAGVPPAQPAAARGRSCTTTIKKKSSLPSQWSDQTSDQPAYNNDSGGGGNNGLCDVTRDGRTERGCSPLSAVHELISLSRFQV